MGGVMIAAPRSGAGKTLLTLGILRAMRDRGIAVAPAKAGPDYIDPTYHARAAGCQSFNLDPWAMHDATMRNLTAEPGPLVVESAMGLFDGAADGSATAADLAVRLGLNIVLILDCGGVGASIAATLRGFATHRSDVRIAGVILNRVASERHQRIVLAAIEPVCAEHGVTILGCIPRDQSLSLPSRHLGLVPAAEFEDVERVIRSLGALCADRLDLGTLVQLAERETGDAGDGGTIPPLGQRIAIASDVAFAFAYPHMLNSWRAQRAQLTTFSPLSDEPPDPDADAVFLPGGYPELHAGQLSNAARFREGVKAAAERSATVYGECGGYMVLGERLRDAEGVDHPMLGLLPVSTSFAEKRLHLGYRTASAQPAAPRLLRGSFRAHEFHHATIVEEGDGDALFSVTDAEGVQLPDAGRVRGSVAGSFIHLIDRAP